MDWKLFATTFLAVFLAELGDKTQLATFGMAAASEDSRWTVFAASSVALVTCSAIAVGAAAWIGKAVPLAWIERAGGVMFLVLGAWFLWRSFHPSAA
ncbi:MAG: TMEM165/GDT1 family protein [Planctomycetota bacterium]|jgi:putative Ca2+/H+ antiporter (TMEM165/GDT1 family)